MSNYNFVKPNYYAIIPANVRYDDKLPANAKLLYGEITALCNKEGRCWASNNYFAELYGLNKRSITRLIQVLNLRGYIKMTVEYKEGTKQISKRYVQICHEVIDKNVTSPIDKNVYYNNTSINTTFNIPTVDELEKYKKEKGYQCDVKQFFNYHESKGWIVGKVKMKNWKRALSFWESNNKKWSKKDGDKTTARATYASSIYDYDKATDF
jgi:hypothetical protein